MYIFQKSSFKKNSIDDYLAFERLKQVYNSFLNYNPGQNIWNKIEKSSKIGQNKKRLTSTFQCFLTVITKI